MDSLDVYQQGFVADASAHPRLAGLIRVLTTPVLEVAVFGAHTQHFARQCDRPMGLVFGNPGVPHSDSRAKYAVAFFKMLRSIVTRASCARSRANSICSALTGLSPTPASCPL